MTKWVPSVKMYLKERQKEDRLRHGNSRHREKEQKKETSHKTDGWVEVCLDGCVV